MANSNKLASKMRSKLQSMNQDKKRFLFLIIIVCAIFVGEFLGIALDLSNTAAFKAGLIDEIELKARRGNLFIFLAVYTVIVFFCLIEFGHFLRHTRDEFQTEQALCDTHQVDIVIDEYDTFTYQFQSKPDKLKKVNTTEEMKSVLTNSTLFEQLLRIDSADVMIDINLLKAATEKLEKSETDKEILIPKLKNPIFNEILKAFPDIFFKRSEYLHLYYADIISSKILDNKEESDESKEFMDRLSEITGFFILSPDKEFQFYDRLNLAEEEIMIRKNYGSWKLYKFVFDNTPFFIDCRLLEDKVSNRSLETAEIKALAFMTHLAIDRDQELEQQLVNQEADIENYQKLIDEREDKVLLRKVLNGDLERSWISKFEFRRLNATSIIVSLLVFALGLMGGLMFG